MPGFDRRGPNGAGPMTGGGRGLCNNATQGNRPFGGFGYGRGGGFGRGVRGNRWLQRGYGWGTRAGESGSSEDTAGELEMLKAQANSIQETLDTISRKMADLEKSSE